MTHHDLKGSFTVFPEGVFFSDWFIQTFMILRQSEENQWERERASENKHVVIMGLAVTYHLLEAALEMFL